jgi:hypothetical protein
LHPQRYLEIGTRTGNSLRLAKCRSIAIDPRFAIRGDLQDGVGQKPACLLFQTTSDDFFATVDPVSILGGPIDLAFIDGMHKFDFVLRDFMNVERHSHRETVIVLHDALPGELPIAAREPGDPIRKTAAKPTWWAGDVWKAIPILQSLRPDLEISIFDARPTGLVIIRNTNSSNDALAKNYKTVVNKYLNEVADQQVFDELWDKLTITSTSALFDLIPAPPPARVDAQLPTNGRPAVAIDS